MKTICGPNNLFNLDPLFRDTAAGDYSLLPPHQRRLQRRRTRHPDRPRRPAPHPGRLGGHWRLRSPGFQFSRRAPSPARLRGQFQWQYLRQPRVLALSAADVQCANGLGGSISAGTAGGTSPYHWQGKICGKCGEGMTIRIQSFRDIQNRVQHGLVLK